MIALMHKRSRIVLAAGMLLALFFYGCKTQQSAGGNQEKKAHRPGTLRVMTYNIHHANPPSKEGVIDIEAIARVISEAQPDLVALQEVDEKTTRSGVTLSQAEALGRLTGMHAYFSHSMDFAGGQYGNAVLSRFPILDTMHFELPPERGSIAEVRSIGIIKVQPDKGRPIYFASTHLDAGRDETSRTLQARKIIEIARRLTLPLVLGGDFNTRPGSPTMSLLDELFTMTCIADCPFTIPAENPKATIDHVIYMPSKRFKTESVKTIPETYASDHLPVLVTLELR